MRLFGMLADGTGQDQPSAEPRLRPVRPEGREDYPTTDQKEQLDGHQLCLMAVSDPATLAR